MLTFLRTTYLLLSCCFLSVHAQADVQVQTKETVITLDTGSGVLEGSLLEPQNSNSNAVALIIAGSGPTDRNGNNPQMVNNSLKMLAHQLSNIGVASVRYDKRGVGKSKSAGLEESQLRFEHYINDAKSWVNHLAKLEKFKSIIVVGHSEGSLIGMVTAQQNNVDLFISLAGAGQPIDQVIRHQLKAQPAFILEQSTPILDKLLTGETVENVPTYLHSLFRPSVQNYMISWFKYNPQSQIALVKKPVLIVNGTTDLQVSIEDAHLLKQANKSATKVLIEGMNHIFKTASNDRQSNFATYSNPDLPLAPKLTSAINTFIKNNM